DQLAQSGAREILHVAEVQKQVPVTLVLHQAVELIAHFLDVFLGHDLGVDETDDRDPIDGFQAEMTTRRLRHRGRLLCRIGTALHRAGRVVWFGSVQAGPAGGPLGLWTGSGPTVRPTEARTKAPPTLTTIRRRIKGAPGLR